MTSSIKWEPIEDLKAIRAMIGRTFSRPRVAVPMRELIGARASVDLYETAEGYVAEIDVPGMEVGDLDISVSRSRLTVTGERRSPEESASYLHRERSVAKLKRTLRVPGDADVDQITAKLNSGVLTVTMPRCEAAEGVAIDPESAPLAKE